MKNKAACTSSLRNSVTWLDWLRSPSEEIIFLFTMLDRLWRHVILCTMAGEDFLNGWSSRGMKLAAYLHLASISGIRDAIPWLVPDRHYEAPNQALRQTDILHPEHSNAKTARTSKYLQNEMKAVKLVEDAWPATEFSALIRSVTASLRC